MKLQELRENVKRTLVKKMNIKQSLSIMNIPKQNFLDKGDLIMLLDNEQKTVAMEWLKDGHYHIELKTSSEFSIIDDILKNPSTRIFETKNFEADFDTDYVIDYKNLTVDTKKKIRNLIKDAEDIFYQRYSRFSNGIDKKIWLRSIQLQNGNFTQWCEERGYENNKMRGIKEAYKIAEETNDYHLKKRAAFAKCFIKVSQKRNED